MLGLNGYEKNIELFELCLSNQCGEALKVYDDILQNGVQPLQIISNLLEISHLASKINLTFCGGSSKVFKRALNAALDNI